MWITGRRRWTRQTGNAPYANQARTSRPARQPRRRRRERPVLVGAACVFGACLAAAKPAVAQTLSEAEADRIQQPGLFDDLGHDVKGLSPKTSRDDCLTAHFTGGRDTEEAFERATFAPVPVLTSGGAGINFVQVGSAR